MNGWYVCMARIAYSALAALGHVHAEELKPRQCPTSALPGLEMLAPGVTIERPIRIRSKDFSWEHEIQVALPASYTTGHRAYPVLWVLDGSVYFPTAIQAVNGPWVNGPWKKYLPETIIIGIGVPADASEEFQARRAYEFTLNKALGFEGIGGNVAKRTLENAGGATALAKFGTGGAPKFLAFLADDLRGTLEKKYRMSGRHTLFGTSGGGFFCTYALLVRPKAFDKYICLSPSLNVNEYELFRLEDKYAAENNDLPAAVYFAAGEGEILEGGIISGLGIVSSMSRMAEILHLRNYPSLKLHVHIFPDEEHGTYQQVALSRGLRALWEINDAPL